MKEESAAESNDELNSRPTKKLKAADESFSFFDLRTAKGQILFIVVTCTIAVLVSQLPVNQLKDFINSPRHACPKVNNFSETTRKPSYWIYGAGGEGQWVHVNKVLQRLGFERVSQEKSATADLLWAHDYPFTKLRAKILDMKPHQKINHFPGCGFLTNKVDLCTTTKYDFIPKAFKLPTDQEAFKKYAEKNPKALFVVKHHQHRHIKIKNVQDINLKDNLTFVQEFIENPLLVDGHKFDIGVYTIITSVNPLRVYIYYGDILFRYCPVKYYPFDKDNVDKYIVGDDYKPTWDLPSLSRFYSALGYGMKGSFDAYMRSKGRNPQVIWDQVEEEIRLTILDKEKHIVASLKRYNSKNFFEMMRFDLIIDDNLKVHLMEANMSPNLSSAHFKQNTILYEQVIFNLLNLVGVGHYLHRDSLVRQATDTELMLSTDKNIMVNADTCGQLPCSESCAPIECQLCKPCLTNQDIAMLHLAYREHVNRGDTKRIFPPSTTNFTKFHYDEDYYKNLNPRNRLMVQWFRGKCLTDASWC